MTDKDTKKIVGMQTLDKRETENEKYQFRKKLDLKEYYKIQEATGM